MTCATESTVAGTLFGWPRIHVDAIDSTMPAMAQLARSGARHGTVLIANFQCSGTGRQGRAWVAPSGSSLLMSVLIKTSKSLPDIAVLSLLIGGCVSDTLDELGISAEIKWPNDVLVGGRKISGILVRSCTSAESPGLDLVVGIGINLDSRATEGLAFATSVAAESTSAVERRQVLDRLLGHMGQLCLEFERDEHHSRVRSINDRLGFRGEVVTIETGEDQVVGRVEGVRDDGALIVARNGGEREYIMSGELQRGPRPIQPAR
jgi:BirA family biotin operon repressor/biotin-[acetyl-CoA-carboxylase] ligase